MIIKGSCRGGSAADGKRLADHLLDARGNERVTVLEFHGLSASGLHEAFEEMRALSLATRTRRPLYHASISPAADEARRMTPRHWIEAADELERRLGLVGHQRVLIRHDKNGRGHLHIVWNRCDSVTLKVAHDGHTYARHEACARALEARWRLRPVIGAHIRPKGIARPVAAINHKEHQAEIRTGIPTAEVAAILRQCWRQSPDGPAFAVAVHLAGLTLANGRRGVIVLDPAGTPHSLARRLGLKAAHHPVARRPARRSRRYPDVAQRRPPDRRSDQVDGRGRPCARLGRHTVQWWHRGMAASGQDRSHQTRLRPRRYRA